jgi:hypothetical protein
VKTTSSPDTEKRAARGERGYNHWGQRSYRAGAHGRGRALPLGAGVQSLDGALSDTSFGTHYYTNDFARRCPFINGGGHKIQLPWLMLVINGGGHFLITEVGTEN